MRLGIGLGLPMATNTRRYDAEDLTKGTLSLNFAAPYSGSVMSLNFVSGTHQVWEDDPTWPYGLAGIFRIKA